MNDINKQDIILGGITFKSLAAEEWREYTFPGGDKVTIKNPIGLHVSASGGHRIVGQRRSHYIPAGWIHLEWKVRPGEEAFQF